MTIKIEAAKRLAQHVVPKPPWYQRSLSQVPSYKSHLDNLTTPFPRCDLKLLEKIPNTVGDWGASWTIDFTGSITILIQTSFFESCRRAGLDWELVHTLQHEYMEAKIAIALARKKYPGDSPFIMAEKDQNIGGVAHEETIEKLDGISESAYNKGLADINKFLKFYKT